MKRRSKSGDFEKGRVIGVMMLTELVQVEQQIQRLQMIFWICCVTGAICILTALFTFFVFHIPKIIGELSGETAKRQIRELERANENPYQRKRNRLFDTGKGISWDMKNQTINQAAEPIEEEQETQILDSENQTTVLPQTRTAVLEVQDI